MSHRPRAALSIEEQRKEYEAIGRLSPEELEMLLSLPKTQAYRYINSIYGVVSEIAREELRGWKAQKQLQITGF